MQWIHEGTILQKKKHISRKKKMGFSITSVRLMKFTNKPSTENLVPFIEISFVLQDSVNRKTIMDLLLNNARNWCMSSRQFLFLTPLDCSILDSAPDLTIHKMRDPERYGVMSQ